MRLKTKLIIMMLITMMTGLMCACGSDVEIEFNLPEDSDNAQTVTDAINDIKDEIAEKLEGTDNNEYAYDAYYKVISGSEKFFDADGNEYDFGDYYDPNEITVKYAFVDLNDDGIDEFIVQTYGAWLTVFTCADGKVTEINGIGSMGTARQFILNNKVITVADNTHDARVVVEAYRLNKNNEIEPIISFEHWFPTEISPEVEESYTKYVGSVGNSEGETISPEEFEKLFKEYTEDEMILEWKDIDAQDTDEVAIDFDFSLEDFSFGGYHLGPDMYDGLVNSGIPNLGWGVDINPYVCMKPFDGYVDTDSDAEWNSYIIMFDDSQYYCMKEFKPSKNNEPHYQNYTENFGGPIKVGMNWEEVCQIIKSEEIVKKAYETKDENYNNSTDWARSVYHFSSNVFGEHSSLVVSDDRQISITNEDNYDKIYMVFDEEYTLVDMDIQMSK